MSREQGGSALCSEVKTMLPLCEFLRVQQGLHLRQTFIKYYCLPPETNSCKQSISATEQKLSHNFAFCKSPKRILYT